MTWQGFAYGTMHAARDDATATLSIVDTAGATQTDGDNSDGVLAGVLSSAYDDRAGSAFEWLAAERLRLDRSASPGTVPDTLFIPAGHNLTAAEVFSRVTSGGTATSLDTWSGTTSDPVVLDLGTLAGTDRYLDFEGTTADANVRIGEAIYTALIVPTLGPEREWDDTLQPIAVRSALAGGGSVLLARGTSQRVLELDYPNVDNATDRTTLAAVEATAGVPFVLRPSYTDQTDRWVILDGTVRRIEQSGLPAAQTTLIPGYRFRFREHTL